MRSVSSGNLWPFFFFAQTEIVWLLKCPVTNKLISFCRETQNKGPEGRCRTAQGGSPGSESKFLEP
jgi:hypothetical protein